MLRFVPRQCSLFAMRWRTDAADVACWCRTARARKLTTPDQARQCRYLPIVSPRSIDAWGQAASRPAAAMAGMCPGLQRGTYGRSLAARCTASLSLPTDRCDLGTDRQTDRSEWRCAALRHVVATVCGDLCDEQLVQQLRQSAVVTMWICCRDRVLDRMFL